MIQVASPPLTHQPRFFFFILNPYNLFDYRNRSVKLKKINVISPQICCGFLLNHLKQLKISAKQYMK